MVGFWILSYASSLNVPGYHFHFVSDDRRHGGHVLDHGDLRAQQLEGEVQRESDLGQPKSAGLRQQAAG